MTYNYIPSTNQLIVKSNTGIQYLFTYNSAADTFTDNSGGVFYNTDTRVPPVLRPPEPIKPDIVPSPFLRPPEPIKPDIVPSPFLLNKPLIGSAII
jgi:hypothetical protein